MLHQLPTWHYLVCPRQGSKKANSYLILIQDLRGYVRWNQYLKAVPQQSPNRHKLSCLLVKAADLSWAAEHPSDGSEGRCQMLGRALEHGDLLWNTGFQYSRLETASSHQFVYSSYRWLNFFEFYCTFFMSSACYSHWYPLFEKKCHKEAIVRVEFWAWKMPSFRKKGIVKATPWGPCEQRLSAEHAAKARGREVVIYCYTSHGPRLLHHTMWAYLHQ